MGGFLSGTFWGAIVGVVALLVSSLTLDRQQMSFPKPEASAVEVPGGSEFDQAKPEAETILPTTEVKPDAEITIVEPPEDVADEPPELDTAALKLPEPDVDAPAGLGDAPEAPVDEQPDVVTDTTPAGDAGELTTPETPGEAPVTEVEDPVAPVAEEEGETLDVATSVEEKPAEEAETVVAALPEAVTEAEQPETVPAPEVTSVDDAPEAPAQPEIAEDSALPSSGGAEINVDESPEAPKLPQITEEPSLPSGDETPDVAEAPEAPPSPSVTEESSGAGTITVDGGPSALKPVDELGDQAEGVETARLPQAGDSSLPTIRRIGVADDTPEEEEQVEDATVELETETPDGPALVVNRADFDNPEGRPLLSVVLIHTDGPALSADILDGLPAHVSFAVDAGNAQAAEIASAYRDSGREVVMIPSLPDGAQPQDVEQALRVNFDAIPQAVAVMDITGSSFQSDRSAVQQVVDVVAASGHGIITFPRGLNAAHQQAQRAGVPTGLIFRYLDGGSETSEQIQRTMDRAAFRARQNEGVILVGTTQATTLAALVEWALGNRAESVTIAPISAALQAN